MPRRKSRKILKCEKCGDEIISGSRNLCGMCREIIKDMRHDAKDKCNYSLGNYAGPDSGNPQRGVFRISSDYTGR